MCLTKLSSYFPLFGWSDFPFWRAAQQLAGQGIRGIGALAEGAGKISEVGFDATKDAFDTVKTLPVTGQIVAPVKTFAENGLDVTDQTITESLRSVGSFLQNHGHNTQQRALHEDRYRYGHPVRTTYSSGYRNSDESDDSDEEDQASQQPSKPVVSVTSYLTNGNNPQQRSFGSSFFPWFNRK